MARGKLTGRQGRAARKLAKKLKGKKGVRNPFAVAAAAVKRPKKKGNTGHKSAHGSNHKGKRRGMSRKR